MSFCKRRFASGPACLVCQQSGRRPDYRLALRLLPDPQPMRLDLGKNSSLYAKSKAVNVPPFNPSCEMLALMATGEALLAVLEHSLFSK